MTERQALGIDISHWARTGGVNFQKVQRCVDNGTYDFLIIKAGQGGWTSTTFHEQIHGADEHGIPHSTYYFLDPNVEIDRQSRHYVDLVGTNQTSYFVDVEIPYPPEDGGRLPTRLELLTMLDELERLTQVRPIIYTRVSILRDIRFMTAARDYQLWIAQYLWDRSIYPFQKLQYTTFDDFLDDYAGTIPPSIRGTGLTNNVILWQFSEKGDGAEYVFNELTSDPLYPIGKKSADLNVSIQGRDEFISTFLGTTATAITVSEPVGDAEGLPTYPGLTNQDIINLFLRASSIERYWGLIRDAGLEYLAIPRENRAKPYTGPRIEDLPNLRVQDKNAILAVM